MCIWLTYNIYQQIQQQKDLGKAFTTIQTSLQTTAAWKLYVVIILMFMNWGIEAKKWQLLISHIQHISFLRAFRAVFTGQAIAFNTLNGVGEYLGRIVYLADGNKIRAIALSIIGSISQLIITLLMGIVGLLLLHLSIFQSPTILNGLSKLWLNGLMYALSLVTICLVIFYFNISWLAQFIEKLPYIHQYRYYFEKIEDLHWKELTFILLLSFARYVVFVFQYLLLLNLFGVDANLFSLACMVCVLFLVLAVIPTIPIAELGVRGEASKQLFGLLSTNALGIVFSVVVVWFINRVLPAITGSLFVLGIRLFKNK